MDVARYGGWRKLLTEQSLWAVLWFRLGSALLLIRFRPLRRLCLAPWFAVYKLLETLLGISLPLGLQAGGGLRIWHFGGIFVNVRTVVGVNCTLRQGVTLGSRYEDGPGPCLGDNVDLGAYAQVLGAVTVGNDTHVGAMSVVLIDVPDGCTAVGIPARVVTRSSVTRPSNWTVVHAGAASVPDSTLNVPHVRGQTVG